MSGNRYLLDTNAVIKALNERLVLPPAESFVSVITEIELLSFAKLTDEDAIQIKCFLKDIYVIDLTEEVKYHTILLRRKNRVKLPDAVICASSISYRATLVTEDVRLHNGAIDHVVKLNDMVSGC